MLCVHVCVSHVLGYHVLAAAWHWLTLQTVLVALKRDLKSVIRI